MSSIEYSGESWKVNGNGYVKWCEGEILKKKKKNDAKVKDKPINPVNEKTPFSMLMICTASFHHAWEIVPFI